MGAGEAAIQQVASGATERTDYFNWPGYSYPGYDYDGFFVWFSFKKPVDGGFAGMRLQSSTLIHRAMGHPERQRPGRDPCLRQAGFAALRMTT